MTSMINKIKHHIVFGDSAAGVLTYYFNLMKMYDEREIINIIDDFMIGPLSDYNNPEGKQKRCNWLKKIIDETKSDEGLIEYFKNGISESESEKRINGIAKNADILIWYGENTSNLIGLSYLCKLLKQANDRIYILNLTEGRAENYSPRSLAEINPEELDEYTAQIKKMSLDVWAELYAQWEMLVGNNSLLRIKRNDILEEANCDYYDERILKICNYGYQKCARVIGEVLGTSEDLLSDLYIDWRIRELIKSKKLKTNGRVETMRDFYIKSGS